MCVSQIRYVALLIVLACQNGWGAEDQGAAGVFVINNAPEFTDMQGECIKYTQDAVPGPHKQILAFAKPSGNAFVLMVAFDAGKDSLLHNLIPVASEQIAGVAAVRFPAGEGPGWSFSNPDKPADLFVVMCTIDDPGLPALRKNIVGLQTALQGKQAELVLLQSSALRSRLTSLLRSRPATAEVRIEPTSIAAVRRGLKTLGEDWKTDSLPLSYARGKPGILLFKIGNRS